MSARIDAGQCDGIEVGSTSMIDEYSSKNIGRGDEYGSEVEPGDVAND